MAAIPICKSSSDHYWWVSCVSVFCCRSWMGNMNTHVIVCNDKNPCTANSIEECFLFRFSVCSNSKNCLPLHGSRNVQYDARGIGLSTSSVPANISMLRYFTLSTPHDGETRSETNPSTTQVRSSLWMNNLLTKSSIHDCSLPSESIDSRLLLQGLPYARCRKRNNYNNWTPFHAIDPPLLLTRRVTTKVPRHFNEDWWQFIQKQINNFNTS